MDDIVDVLVEKETVSGEEFRNILSRYTTIPEGNQGRFDKSDAGTDGGVIGDLQGAGLGGARSGGADLL